MKDKTAVRMTAKGNVVFDGVKYKAVPGLCCSLCALATKNCHGIACEAPDRGDTRWKHQGVDVAFVRKVSSP